MSSDLRGLEEGSHYYKSFVFMPVLLWCTTFNKLVYSKLHNVFKWNSRYPVQNSTSLNCIKDGLNDCNYTMTATFMDVIKIIQ